MTPDTSQLQVLIIGLGLIGGSLAKALKQKSFAYVLGYDLDAGELQQGLDLGVIDEACFALDQGVPRADLVVIAVPVKACEAVFLQIAPWLRSETIITDVGSTKANVIAAAKQVFGQLPPRFIPGHPIAGSEKSGVTAADAGLFVKHKVIITPHEQADLSAVQTVARLWQWVGAEVLQMSVTRHDQVLAATSHLPHILAFSLVDTLAKEQDSSEIFRYAAGGFRDFTRIAASDPTMWHDVCIANRSQLLAQIDIFTAGLAQLRQAIDQGDSQTMLGVFTRARAAREHFNKMLSGSAYSQKHHQAGLNFHARSCPPLKGRLSLPGDKSISHRAVILGAIAQGITEVDGFLESEDSLATLQALRDMGVVIEGPHLGRIKIYGVGLYGLCAAPGPLYLGNSATSMRLLSGLLAAQPFASRLLGNESLSRRPMQRIASPLRQMGAHIETAAGGGAPVTIMPAASGLTGLDYALPLASAQVKSCLLLAGLYASGVTRLQQPAPCRDHTEKMLQTFGARLQHDGDEVVLTPGAPLLGQSIVVPGDISSAAFFILAATLVPGSDLTLVNVGVNPTRTGVIDILRRMGADIEVTPVTFPGNEPVADIQVRAAALRGIEIPTDLLSMALDEFPVICIAAALAHGQSRCAAISELKYKESDRLQAMTSGLKKLGIHVEMNDESIVIHGGSIQAGRVNSYQDHRVAMAFAVAGMRAEGEVTIESCQSVATSFPDFIEVAQRAGMRIHKEETHVSG